MLQLGVNIYILIHLPIAAVFNAHLYQIDIYDFFLQKTKYHRSQTLGYNNGYALQKNPVVGIGGDSLPMSQIPEKEPEQLTAIPPTLIYGKTKKAPPSTFVPAHLAFDKKVYTFMFYC